MTPLYILVLPYSCVGVPNSISHWCLVMLFPVRSPLRPKCYYGTTSSNLLVLSLHVLHPRIRPSYVGTLEVRRGVWPTSWTLLSPKEDIVLDVHIRHHYPDTPRRTNGKRVFPYKQNQDSVRTVLFTPPSLSHETKERETRYDRRKQRHDVSLRRSTNDMRSWENVYKTCLKSTNKEQKQE